MKKLLFILPLALFLFGCGTPQVQYVTKEVKVAVPVYCNPDIGPTPNYPDTAEAILGAPDIEARAKLVMAGRTLRKQRESDLNAALTACKGPKVPPSS